MPAPTSGIHNKKCVVSIKAALLTAGGLFTLLGVAIAAAMVLLPDNTKDQEATTPYHLSGDVVATIDIVPLQAGTVLNHSDAPVNPQAVISDKEAGLTEDSTFGDLPITRVSDGLTPFKAYQAHTKITDPSVPKIAIILTSYGLSPGGSIHANDVLPIEVTYVLSPYGTDLPAMTHAAHEKGHEVWMGIPVQGSRFGFDDPGPNAVLTGFTPAKNKQRLFNSLGKSTGYAGIVFDTVAGFASAPTTFTEIMVELQKRGLGISILNPAEKAQLSANINSSMTFLPNDVQIDAQPSQINDALAGLIQTAQIRPCLVASFEPSPKTLDVMAVWISSQKKLGTIQFVPLSAIKDCAG